ncbi:MAG: PAS domain-containing protein [Fuerstiella sp.]|nr:PAS domain-containing protein [Fuerstiella sp.]MCP4856565.1 PAS domain-containing protein [Fuerstiella sp.]
MRELNESRRIAERSSHELKRVLQSINDCVWNAIVDDRGLFQYAYLSPVIEQLAGHHVSEFLERPTAYRELVHADDQAAYEKSRLRLHSGQSDHAVYRLQRNDGNTCWVNERVKCTSLQDGRVIQMFGLISDITERVLTEKRLRQKDAELAHVARVSAMGGMAAAIAHELNQPLQAIAAFADTAVSVLDAGKDPCVDLQEINVQISEQALRAGEIIRRLRSFVRKTDGQRSIEDLHAVVRESIEFMTAVARDAGITLCLNLSDSAIHIQADRIQVQQVMVNLIQNSIESIIDQETSDGTISVSTSVVGQEAQIFVEDTGAGVSAASMETLFDPFVTTKNTGLGMGTAICRTIVESHGGRIWATPGRVCGTIVHFTLPVHDKG